MEKSIQGEASQRGLAESARRAGEAGPEMGARRGAPARAGCPGRGHNALDSSGVRDSREEAAANLGSSARTPMSAKQASNHLSNDLALYNRIAATTRMVKRSLFYSGSKTTSDFVQGLVTKWIESEEFQRLAGLPRESQKVALSVRRFIIDEIRRRSTLKRNGRTELLETLELPDDEALEERVAEALAAKRVLEEVARLERGEVNERGRLLLCDAQQTGAVLRLLMDGKTNAEIARHLRVSTGTVSNRFAEGISYLTKLVHNE